MHTFTHMNRIYLDLEDCETKKSPKIQISSQNGGQYFTRKKSSFPDICEKSKFFIYDRHGDTALLGFMLHPS